MIGPGVALAVVFLVIGASIVALNLYGQRRRDWELLARWDGLCAQRDSTPGAVIMEVVEVYQRAMRGTKAVVVIGDSGQRQDAWFEGTAMRPVPHTIWLVKLPVTAGDPTTRTRCST